MSATVRYWAAAKAAAGTAQEQVDAGTLAQVLAAASAQRAELARVFTVCSFLVDEHPVGTRSHADVDVPDGALVDVLPPFAGG